ncbi:anoctamin-7-like isoform X3 [Mercenaria mercenaria]|uniref:anoctamin-7-like isoform X3 n=1 Tax=Mercenaria mercenaria TaxID=6596 RepID=UPI00234E80E5|nr:anoctamin-7-like isoform X3 [Mercenaria mercenaria]
MAHRNHVSPMHEKGEDLEYGSWKVSKPELAVKREKKTEIVIKEKKEKADKFDAFYKKIGDQVIPEDKRIDYVLVHPKVDMKEIEDEDEIKDIERQNQLREKFEFAMHEEGLMKQRIEIDDHVYTKIHCPFRRLCEEAEAVSLEMPLLGCESEHKEEPNRLTDWVTKHLVTDNEVDMVSAPFQMDRIHLYENFNDPTNFFRPSLRSLLVEHMLINIDLRYVGMVGIKAGGKFNRTEGVYDCCCCYLAKSIANCWGCMKEDTELGDMQKVGLDFMRMEGVYTNKFTLHEESHYDPDDDEKKKIENLPTDAETLKSDPRLDMQLTWTKFFKFQPLWKIRNYFGEKIAFYFAWSGTLVETLWAPMIFGVAVFIYGLVESIKETNDSSSTSSSSSSTSNSSISDLFKNIKGSFDNDVTPYFAMFISIWGTLFMEIWKRKQAVLAYQWDVEQFEENEPDRPEFYGTKVRKDPVTNENDWYYPFARRAWKLCISAMTLLFMVILVLVSVMGVIVYRVVALVDYCPDLPDANCLMVSTVMSSLLNAISILILGKLYDMLAVKLTEWENHRTQTMYNDALIIKLFAFQFVNNYSSCFYIAFFRGRFDDSGILGYGPKYRDTCDGTCMSQLSFQVMTLMVTKPLPKLAKDVIIPFCLKIWRKRCQCCSCIPFLRKFLKPDAKPKSEKTLLEIEVDKPTLGNFTLGEYTEKIIQYGLMMLFAASFPLAPLLALLLNAVDMRIDAWRMLWWYQRPMATIAEDIGTWFVILTFVNYVGVVSNGFLIAFTSDWGSGYDTAGKLWIVIGFEHIVFSLKFLIAYLIPDTPPSVALAIRKKKYQLQKKIDEDKMKDKDYVNVTTTTTTRTVPAEKVEQGPLILSRNDGEDGVPRSRRQRSNFVNEEDTEVRRMRKKKKLTDGASRGRDVSPPDYSGRVMPGKLDRTAHSTDWLKI